MHPLVLNPFPKGEIGKFPLAGSLHYFLENWKILANDSKILEWVSGLKMGFQGKPFQERVPHQAQMSMEESQLINQAVEEMLAKRAIHLVHPEASQILSKLFIVPKKEGIKLIHPLLSLQNGKFASVKGSSERENDFMCKVDLKDANFCVPLHRNQQNFIRFQWKGNIYEFLCLCFGLCPAPQIFTKLLKIPIAILRWIQIRIIIYLNDMLLMIQTINDLEIARDTLIFLLQSLSFVIKFLRLEIDSVRMTLTLPQGKVKKKLD